MVKRVFDWRKFVQTIVEEEDNIADEYKYASDEFGYDSFCEDINASWVYECIGKTPDEITDMGYVYKADWFEEVETVTAEDFKALEIGTPIKVVCDGYEPDTFIGEFIAVKDNIVIVAIPEDVVANFFDCEVSVVYDGFSPDYCEIV